MVAASRPLRVDELAEIITIEFGKTGPHPIWRAGFETGVAERPIQLERRDMFSTFKLQVPSWLGDPLSLAPTSRLYTLFTLGYNGLDCWHVTELEGTLELQSRNALVCLQCYTPESLPSLIPSYFASELPHHLERDNYRNLTLYPTADLRARYLDTGALRLAIILSLRWDPGTSPSAASASTLG